MRLKTPVCDSPSRPEKSVHDLGGGRQFDAERGRVDRVFEGLKFLELGITNRVPKTISIRSRTSNRNRYPYVSFATIRGRLRRNIAEPTPPC